MAGKLLDLALDADSPCHKWEAARRDSILQPGEYEWTTLTDVANQIRVCSILPGLAGSELRISLRTINLDDNVDQYVCLSYVWGDTTQTAGIWLNDHHHLVHRNLHLQLLRLRANNVTKPVWCDALCIHQADLGERGTQVAMMDRIFSGAAKVFLGVDEGGLVPFTQSAGGKTSTLQTAIQELSNDSHLPGLSCFATAGTEQGIGEPCDNVAAHQFRRIVNASFFSRCWTVQEVVLAKEAMIMGEWGVLPWSSMVDALDRYNHHRKDCCASFVDTLAEDLKSGCYKLFSHVSSLEYTKTNLGHGQHLVELLQSFGELRATMKKDKLFAFWGLASGPLPAPDYEGTTESVLTNIARWILEDTKDLLLLAMGLPADPDLPGLPSWVPSLSPPALEINYFRRRLRCLDVYDCAKGIPCSIGFEGARVLCLKGMLVDEVLETAKQEFASLDPAPHAALLRDWQSFVSGCPKSEQLCEDVFYETLIAGCSHPSTGAFPVATPSDIRLCREMICRLASGRKFDDDASRFTPAKQAHYGACLDRVLFRTKAGRLGLGPPTLRKGDEVFAFGGAQAPFIVRQTPDTAEHPTHNLIGHAYINGIMQGEAIDLTTPLRTCRLV